MSQPARRRTLLLAVAAGALALTPLYGQSTQEAGSETAPRANYRLAGRFAPYKVRELVHSTSVTPNWIEEGDRFWYEWESPDGKTFYIVDPAAGSRRQLFDNDRIAAELTRITHDPWDGQHLPIRDIRFVDDNTLQFEVESSLDEEKEDQDEEQGEEQRDEQQQRGGRGGRGDREGPKKQIFYFDYDVNTQTLRHLEDYEAPDRHPGWASVSPDDQWVVFTRQCNLHVMSGADYQLIVDARRGKTGDDAEEAEDSVTVNETQLTTDGEKWYCYGSYGRGACR